MPTVTRRPVRKPKPRDPLSQLLASGGLRAVLLYFATHPEAEPTVRALARATHLGPASVASEIDRLALLGVLERRPDGRAVRLALRHEAPLWPALRALVRTAASPAELLRAALADVDGLEEAFIFGSTAQGVDRPDSDVDVVVVGTPDQRALDRRLIDVAVLLGREVNALTYTTPEWAAARASGRPFYRHVAEGPKQWIVRGGAPISGADGERGSASTGASRSAPGGAPDGGTLRGGR